MTAAPKSYKLFKSKLKTDIIIYIMCVYMSFVLYVMILYVMVFICDGM